jgi:hypothetical protein
MFALTASSDIGGNEMIGVFEGTILTISELMEGKTLEEVHLMTMRNVLPVLLPLGTRLVLDGRDSDGKMTRLQHSDNPNCGFSTHIYYQAGVQHTIVPIMLVHTCKAVVEGDIMTVNGSRCQGTLMEWCEDECIAGQ